MAEPLVRISDLSTWFHTGSGVARAVDGVSFDIVAGQTLGLIGESGCGKSVTAMSITGLIDAPGRIQPGSSIRFAGRELVGADEPTLRGIRGAEIGMIFQEPMSSLNPVYTVGAQIAEAVRAHRDVSRREAMDRAVEMLQLVRIAAPERRVHDFPHEMSGGMRQRVMIAIALACEPRLLIADEPTTALDVTTQSQILNLLLDLQERNGMAIMLITHDLGVIAETADDVVVMYL
ncbi:MAG: ABC transporter ATP-binding protein, partial [Chloroflexi bacterium]|nr:ABC transporter ATP-binding protein [Chloroflexota bacterium]